MNIKKTELLFGGNRKWECELISFSFQENGVKAWREWLGSHHFMLWGGG